MTRASKPLETPLETWDSGSIYEPYVGRWSRLIAKQFLAWLDLGSDLRWMDIGCGTGALSFSILEHCNPSEVMGVDPSKGFLRHARETLLDDRVSFYPGSAEELPSAVDDFDAAVSGLVLNFIEDKAQALNEAARVVRPGGTVALYVWDYAEGMEMIRYFWDAAVKLDPAAAALDEGKRFEVCKPERLHALFESVGLANVATTTLEAPTVFHDFIDYWSPFVAGQAPAPTYCAALTDEKRQGLRNALRAALPIADDGQIRLKARAFAVRGTVPA